MNAVPSFADLPQPEPAEGAAPVRICIATQDYLYLVKNGGIGTSFHHTACVLADHGFDVTVLFCGLTDHLSAELVAQARQALAERRIALELVFPEGFGPASLHEFYPSHVVTVSAYAAYHHLKQRDFDVVLFPDWRGLGYYALQAKQLGLAFRRTALWVQAHSTSLWHALSNEQPSYSEFDMCVYHMERRSVAMADLLVSPTRYLLDWKARHGFVLPARTFVQPYLLTGALGRYPEAVRQVPNIREIVFFGRLEKRKGLHLFIRAIRLLRAGFAEVNPARCRLTFLGKVTEIDGENAYDFIMDNLAESGFEIRVLSSLSAVDAVAYLKGEGRMAVIPSVADNSPLTVLECIHNEIPFIAAATGGIPEIVAPDDHAHVLFPLGVRSLAEKLRQAIADGAFTARPAIRQSEANIPQWIGALRAAAQPQAAEAAPPADDADAITVSVCITHFNRPAFLETTLHGLRAQSYKRFEVIIVDDGSTSAEAIRYLDALERAASPFPLSVIRQRNAFVGAARNAGLRRAVGKYVVFMDDDNYADPKQLEIFVSCIEHGGYDALSCAAVAFAEGDDPRMLTSFIHLYTPLGSGQAANLFANYYGDANGIYRTAFLRAIGGFTEDEGLSWEDYELYSRIEQAGGKIGTIPEALLYLRETIGSVSRNGSQLANYYRALRPALDALPWSGVGDAVLVALSPTLGRRAPVPRPDRTVAARHLAGSAEFPVTGLRLLVRRMAERGDAKAAVTTLAEHYAASPTYAFALVEGLFYGLKQGWTLAEIRSALGSSAAAGALITGLARVFAAEEPQATREFLLAEAPAIAETLDGQVILGKLAIILGEATSGLLAIRNAFQRVEAAYLRAQHDVGRKLSRARPPGLLNSLDIRSGLHHWLRFGRDEGRVLDYAAPLNAPLAISDSEDIKDFDARIRDIGLRPVRFRSEMYGAMIREQLDRNSPLILAELAAIVLHDANIAYLQQHRDVAASNRVEPERRGLEHYLAYGRSEGRDSIFNIIDRRSYLDAYEKCRQAHARSLGNQGGPPRPTPLDSFAGSLLGRAPAGRPDDGSA